MIDPPRFCIPGCYIIAAFRKRRPRWYKTLAIWFWS